MGYTDGELRGIGGWLTFFLISIGILSPLKTLFGVSSSLYGDPSIAASYGSIWTTLQLFEWTLVALSIAIAWFIVWRLVKIERWSSVRITIGGIWLIGPGALLVDAAGVSLVTGWPIGDLLVVDFQIVQPFVYASVWTAYFLMSKRVANTYLRNPEQEDLAQTFA